MKGSKIQSLLGENQFSSNKIIWFILMLIIFLSTIMFVDVSAQTLKGRITGKIVDSETGERIIDIDQRGFVKFLHPECRESIPGISPS